MGLITIRNLNTIGRVGNQLFLYAFAKGYARHHGCELQIPADWWGRRVFANVDDAPIKGHPLPTTMRDNNPSNRLGYFFGLVDIDIDVYAQHQTYLQFYSLKDIREWFAFKSEYEEYAPRCDVYSALHQRRGDYVTNPLFKKRYCVVSDFSYQLAIIRHSIPRPVIVVEEGVHPEHPRLKKQGVEWLSDFLLLRNASHLLRANSSFSLWAGWLGKGKVYSPVVGDLVGWNDVPFVEGNHSCTAGFFKNQSDLFLNEN